MGCPSEVEIGDNLTFSVTTQTSAGAAADADAVPTYRIYENETSVAISSGNMALLDSGNTDGLYSENLSCVAASGYENGKTYTIYATAAVGGTTGAATMSFKAYDGRKISASNTKVEYFVLEKDATAQTLAVTVFDSGQIPQTGLINTDISSWYYLRDGDAAPVSVGVNAGTVGSFNGTDVSGTFKEINNVYLPGKYELSLPNDSNAEGTDRLTHSLIFNGAATVNLDIELADLLYVDASGAVKISFAEQDLSSTLHVDAKAIAGSTSGATNLVIGSLSMITGTIIGPTLSTTQMDTDLPETEVNQYVDRFLIWRDNQNEKQAKLVTAYDGAGLLTYNTATNAPASGDKFIIV